MARPPRIPNRRTNAALALLHPVAKPYARLNLKDARTEIKIHLYAHADGADATDLLANLAWFLALALKLEACVKGDTARLRRIHGALRNVQAMCLAGYTWNSVLAGAMDTALIAADAAVDELEAYCDIGVNDAQVLHDMVRAHVIKPDSVMGQELYEQFRAERRAA